LFPVAASLLNLSLRAKRDSQKSNNVKGGKHGIMWQAGA
jgi:hypothetical protein